MDDFERELQRAMARKAPPPWFETKVLAAVGRQPARKHSFWRLEWAVAVFASLLVVSGVMWQHQRERRAGEEARAKLELALKITREKLHEIGQQVETVQGN